MSAPFHFHIQEEFPADGTYPGGWVVDGCAPAEEIESFTKSRDAWLCTSSIWEVPEPFEQCVFQSHKSCHPDGYTCEHIRNYRPIKGSKLFAPGMSKADYEAVEKRRWRECKVCQGRKSEMYGEYCPGH